MKLVFTAILAVFFGTILLAQQPEVRVETGGYVPSVRVWNPAFTAMCKNFADKLGGLPETGMVLVKPKMVLPSRARYAGEVWEVRIGTKSLEVNSSELPAPLNKLRGEVARNVLRGVCYTMDTVTVSTEDMALVTASNAEAMAVADALR